MSDEFEDPFLKPLSESITRDLYAEVKNWLVRQDPAGKKLSKYREGIQRALGSVQIMGMSSPRPLDKIYIALHVVSEFQKEKKFRYIKLNAREQREVLKEVQKIHKQRSYTPRGPGPPPIN